jgi:hypothetical protein
VPSQDHLRPHQTPQLTLPLMPPLQPKMLLPAQAMQPQRWQQELLD